MIDHQLYEPEHAVWKAELGSLAGERGRPRYVLGESASVVCKSEVREATKLLPTLRFRKVVLWKFIWSPVAAATSSRID